MRQTDIRPTTVTGNSTTIEWSKMAVPPGLQDYYKYELQYKVEGNMDWIDGPLISHDPSQTSSLMHYQLTGLKGEYRLSSQSEVIPRGDRSQGRHNRNTSSFLKDFMHKYETPSLLEKELEFTKHRCKALQPQQSYVIIYEQLLLEAFE